MFCVCYVSPPASFPSHLAANLVTPQIRLSVPPALRRPPASESSPRSAPRVVKVNLWKHSSVDAAGFKSVSQRILLHFGLYLVWGFFLALLILSHEAIRPIFQGKGPFSKRMITLWQRLHAQKWQGGNSSSGMRVPSSRGLANVENEK